jgi:16S rRNA (adenine1518-N6/adenine1519-N6)-dimethyltransferase
VARLDVLRQPRFEVPPAFAEVVAAAFSQRRKTLRNSLRRLMSEQAWAQSGIDPGERPENLSPAQFAKLAALAQHQRLCSSSADGTLQPDTGGPRSD